MKIFLAKAFFKVGDIEFNYRKILDIYDKSLKDGCDLLIFSEMGITGFPLYDLVLDRSFTKNSDFYIEKIVDYTKGKKTRMLLGCPYYMEGYEKEEAIKQSQLFNSVILINDGYIDAVNSKTVISKNNLFDEYRYFDREVILKNITYENDNFDVLIADDINENKNIFFIKERDTDFIVCLDTEIEKNIADRKKQLAKIAKWTHKNVIYLNNLGYDLKNNYSFLGESFVVNRLGEFVYSNTSISEDILKFETSIVDGNIEFSPLSFKKKNDESFINLIAGNYSDRKIIFEIRDGKTNIKPRENIVLVTFNKKFENDNVRFIDYKKYTKDLELSNILKHEIIKNVYDNFIFIDRI